MMTSLKFTPLLIMPLVLAACRTNPTNGFTDVQKTVTNRTGQNIEWPRTVADGESIDAKIQESLRHELTADIAVQIAFLNNRNLRATLEELGISRAEVLQAGLLRNPEFAASIRFPDRPPSASNPEFSLAGDFLDLFLLPLRKRVAAIQFEQTKMRVSHEFLQLAAEVRTAFYTVQARQQLGKRLQTIVELNQGAVDLSLRQYKAGNITDLELANQQGSFQQAKLEWGKAQAQLRADRERLTRLLGLWGANTQWKVADQLPKIPEKEISFEHLESLAVQQRLDLNSAKQEADLAARALSLRNKTRYLPATIKLGIDTERDTSRQRVTGPTLDLELPLFDQGRAAIVRLDAQYRQAQWRVEALATDIRSEVRQARDALIAARDLADFYAKIYLPQRIRIVNETLLQYNAMQKGTFELIAARERELTAEREYAEAWRDYWIARGELEKAVGGKLTMTAAPVATNPTQKTQASHEHQENP